ncbi:Ribosomal protein S18 acetylase RimI [Arthrobacter alpinus]|uniref:Ribosomal protein S18 acetylase RimI n=1 Tax=Arthrobacter alpinus TaxID=656366 RepID=A0A1H5EMS2_9MICC|nr:GNAT family N-acetyltransferase [Arthrobacter alpinus]SED92389.1 Ribosomal protein S18 acetylase RimI [Arthrobacter alpinus]
MILATFALADKSFQLRRAVESDVGPIIELIARDQLRAAVESAAPERREPYVAAFHAIDADPAHLLCVVEGLVGDGAAGEVVATMQLTFLPGMARSGATRLQIEAVRVDEQLRGLGLGGAMITWAVDEARRRGAALVQLTSDASRLDAHRFYERLGFTQSHAGFKLQLP